MNVWEQLGIAPTENISKIKSAYAKKAKQYHPEEHPEEFKALQNAYKTALQLAKSRKAGAGAGYVPSGRAVETFRTAGQTVEADTEEEPAPSGNAFEQEPVGAVEDFGQEVKPAHDFDFSDVDDYGDREHFLAQFLLLAKNPYLRNRTEAWDYFLNRNAFASLFSNTEFRKELVRTLCGLHGWQRKTILYFERFLSSFHTEDNKPSDGEWETELRVFCRKKRFRFRLPSFFMDRFWLKEGRTFQRQFRKKVCQLAGREIDLDVRLDLIRYMELYLTYGKEMEKYIDRLYGGWKFEQTLIACSAAVCCLLIVVLGAFSLRHGQERESRMSYLMELYGLDPETCSEEEQRDMYREYNAFWEYSEDAIDDVLERVEEWESE